MAHRLEPLVERDSTHLCIETGIRISSVVSWIGSSRLFRAAAQSMLVHVAPPVWLVPAVAQPTPGGPMERYIDALEKRVTSLVTRMQEMKQDHDEEIRWMEEELEVRGGLPACLFGELDVLSGRDDTAKWSSATVARGSTRWIGAPVSAWLSCLSDPRDLARLQQRAVGREY